MKYLQSIINSSPLNNILNKYFEIEWPLSCLKVNLFESGFHVNDPTWKDENEFFKVTKHNNIKNTVVATINLSDLRFVNVL